MAIIRPSADLRNKYKEISELCKLTQEPIYITVNRKEDTAIISSRALDELYQTIDLMQKINEGIADVQAGRTMSLEERRSFSPAYESTFDILNAKSYVNEGNVYRASIEIVSNGLYGKLTILLA